MFERHLERIAAAWLDTTARGDIVATRRNDRQLTTDGGDSLRNRELWTVTKVHAEGTLIVRRLTGRGTVSLPAEYVAEHGRLGYAATEHGNQSDTVNVGVQLVTGATTRRGLYVGATRGRAHNVMLVVTEEPDVVEARDTLERVLASDPIDVPATILPSAGRRFRPYSHTGRLR